MNETAPRRVWLCADDYGISPGVNRGIRDLIARGRLNATSVMVVGPAVSREEVATLQEAAASSSRCAIGLHVTLTAPFRPLTMHFRPLNGGLFPSFPRVMIAGFARRLDPEIIQSEVAVQLAAFASLFGRAPDFVDGHQHVQVYPQVRDAFLAAVKQAAPQAWVRQSGRAPPARSLRAPKALILDLLSAEFRRRAAGAELAFNPGFAGAYDFSREPDFGALMGGFLEGLTEHSVIMCHPGFVDETLIELDPFTVQREHEHAYLASDQFPELLRMNNVTLA
ncbi:ChbG/HpnK family deacetylase [Bradyrhizobium sp.]|uniref:ChbG/HpnK family deacetylase n=1 Tax=Bradyrhizobium sp. TaxID=376 RepID=UPI0025BB8DAD|nr:ChbG/HpnK family deacetylase [Bradyrhizobium sp.]MBV8922635.1 ChbG/HpnK family deacetylase [Bradyrhizobium sp.]